MPQFVTQPQSVDLCNLYKELFVPLKIIPGGFFVIFSRPYTSVMSITQDHYYNIRSVQLRATLGAKWQYLRKVYIENINTTGWRWDGGGVCSY